MLIRVLAIIQLCLAFTLLLYRLGEPFMAEAFAYKSRLTLYHFIMGQENEGNAKRFQQQPEAVRTQILAHYEQLKKSQAEPFLSKFGRAWHLLLVEISALERLWIVLSIAIAILLLLQFEGASQAVYLLPLITLFYVVDNISHVDKKPETNASHLYPSEQTIIANYLNEPLSNNIMEQQRQLTLGWNHYLIREWAQQEDSTDSKIFAQQVAEGEFLFNLKRLQEIAKYSLKEPVQQRESSFMLLLYLLWNGLFAVLAGWPKRVSLNQN